MSYKQILLNGKTITIYTNKEFLMLRNQIKSFKKYRMTEKGWIEQREECADFLELITKLG